MEHRSLATHAAAAGNSPLASHDSGQLKELDVETVRELWSRTYNALGKPDWSHIYPYYHPDIVFQDSIQRIEGIDEFMALCQRLTSRCEKLQMDISAIAKSGNTIFMEWTMTMVFKKSPNTPIYGATRLTLHSDGRIVEQRDYYDLWGDIINGIPYLKGAYRKFMRRFFG